MVEIRPFRAIRYTVNAGNLKDLVTQPYDKITPQMQNGYYQKSPYNFCRLILPSEEDRYEVAKKNLGKYLSERMMVKDAKPGIYVYFMDFELFGKKHLRKGFICALKLSPFEENVVLPHEKTHKGPKIDRLNMLRATLKNLEPGFMLFPDPKNEISGILDNVARARPLIVVDDEYGVSNRIWKLEDPAIIAKLQAAVGPEQIVIADGHHRYETAVTFRDELRAADTGWTGDDAFNFSMSYLVAVNDGGLVILPGHRLLLKQALTDRHIAELGKYFELSELGKDSAQAFLEKNQGRICFVAYTGNGNFLGLVLRDIDAVAGFLKPEYSPQFRRLDVVVLRDVVFEGIMNARDLKISEDIDYSRWIPEALENVDSKKAKVAFLLNATRPEQVLAVARNGERMPQKSTDFYPKMISGLTMMDIGPGEKLAK
jgi:uncharacterized protein (DUF1015 family)